MEAVRDIISALYDKFLLRDVFGKMMPGFIIILSILAMTNNPPVSPICMIEKLAHAWTLGVFLIVLGVSWIIGFVPQQVLRIRCLVRHRLVVSSETRSGKFIKIYSAFSFNDSKEKIMKQLMTQRERHAVINEATGNLAISLVPFIIALIIPMIVSNLKYGIVWSDIVSDIIACILTIFIIVFLFKRHRYSRNRQHNIEDKIIQLRNRIH